MPRCWAIRRNRYSSSRSVGLSKKAWVWSYPCVSSLIFHEAVWTMPRTSSSRLWSTYTLAGHHYQLLNPDHPEVAAHVLGDLDAGIAVYYDSRWDLTTQFCRFLLAHPTWVAGLSVLVLGA